MIKSALSDRDMGLISKYLLGGAAIGGSAALATSLVNYIKHLSESRTKRDDDTLYIYKNKQDPGMAKSAVIGGGVALTGGLLSAIGTYAAVNKVYSELRKRQAQSELDKAQTTFLGVQGYNKTTKKKQPTKDKPEDKEPESEVKEASAQGKPMSLMEGVTSLPVALPLLLALGSGVIAHKMLDRAFPVIKDKAKAPRRVEIMDKNPNEDTSSDQAEYIEKPAFVREDDGLEFLLRMIHIEKRASSDIGNMVATLAADGLDDFERTCDTVGFTNALDTIKGASFNQVDPLGEHVAIAYLTKSARFSNLAGIIAAGEFAENHPQLYKIACGLPEVAQDALYGITQLFGHSVRSERSEELGITTDGGTLRKLASTKMVADLQLATKSAAAEDEEQPEAKGDSSESSGTSGEEAGADDPTSPSRKKKTRIVASSKTGRGFLTAIDEDVIDKILTPSKE